MPDTMFTLVSQLIPSVEASFTQVILNGTMTTWFVSWSLTVPVSVPDDTITPTAVAVTMFSVLSQMAVAGMMHEALELAEPATPSVVGKQLPRLTAPPGKLVSVITRFLSSIPAWLQLVTVIR